mmetsp:Transcript_1122/g.4293  ORF Transcript_1122/g.4293 Transcript_1122/m.4293 type:complete len:272 (+) Transcript_1122:4567-5382(+)
MNPAADPVRAAQTLRCPTTAARRSSSQPRSVAAHKPRSRLVASGSSWRSPPADRSPRPSAAWVRSAPYLRRSRRQKCTPPPRSSRRRSASHRRRRAPRLFRPRMTPTSASDTPPRLPRNIGTSATSLPRQKSLPRQSRAARRRTVPTRKAPRAARADVSPPVAPPHASSPPPRLLRDQARALCDAPRLPSRPGCASNPARDRERRKLTRRGSPCRGADRGRNSSTHRREGAAAGRVDASARVRGLGAALASSTTPSERTSRRRPARSPELF